MSVPFTYVGSELDLFEAATNWKNYVHRQVAPYLGGSVLEVGAGHGGTTKVLCRRRHDRWVCLEPDAGLAERTTESIADGTLPSFCRSVVGTVDDLGDEPPFDSALYMDVIEHIEDDRAELARVAGRLKPGGHLIVLSPAHQWLFTPFDEAIGHYRRYTLKTLRAAAPTVYEPVRLRYLDAVGMLASLGNRLLLRRSMPNAGQIAAWDKLMVPCSRLVDPVLGYRVGKSVLGIWKKRPG